MPDADVHGAPFLAACIQMRSGIDPARNLSDAAALIREAAGAGARFISTPEMTTVLDRDAGRLFSHLQTEEENAELPRLRDLALDLGVFLHLGSLAVRLGERRAANRSFLLGPDGRIVARYDKIHMFDVVLPDGESWRESAIYAAGDRAVVAQTPLAGFALSVCYDVRFPALYRAAARAGAEALLVPAAFTRQTGIAHWETLLRARAIENGAFVIAAAQGGTHDDGRATFGHSMIVGPWGDVRAQAAGDDPGVVLASIDPAEAHKARRAIPNLALDPSYEVLNVKV